MLNVRYISSIYSRGQFFDYRKKLCILCLTKLNFGNDNIDFIYRYRFTKKYNGVSEIDKCKGRKLQIVIYCWFLLQGLVPAGIRLIPHTVLTFIFLEQLKQNFGIRIISWACSATLNPKLPHHPPHRFTLGILDFRQKKGEREWCTVYLMGCCMVPFSFCSTSISRLIMMLIFMSTNF